MTTKPSAARYNIRPVQRFVDRDASADGKGVVGKGNDGLTMSDVGAEAEAPQLADAGPSVQGPGEATNAAKQVGAQQPVRKAETPEEIEAVLASIANERISKRHLRRALLIAQTHEIVTKSEFDAVRLLREAGIDPFSLSSMVRIPKSGDVGRSLARATPPHVSERELARLPGDTVQLPKRSKSKSVPSTERRAEVNQAAEILRMQQDIARQRRRRLALLAARIFAFVLLPTFIAGWYFYLVATPMYSVQSEFLIQQAGPKSSNGSLSGLFSGTALANSSDSNAVEGYLQSLDVMVQLDADSGFRDHFQSDSIDPLKRLAPDATLDDAYSVYRKHVKVTYDEKDDVIRMDVIAADPKVAAAWSHQLIGYAEGQVDRLTQRMRADQMRDAQEAYDAAHSAFTASQRRLIELQKRFKIISSETEVSLIFARISGLEGQITQERLSLAQMEANPEPNQARMEPIKRRIATLEAQVAELRAWLTGLNTGETSLAKIQGELAVAQADLNNREILMAQALQSTETARVEVNRQVRYLSVSVNPIPPDEPAFPRALENTVVTMVILLGIYLIISTAVTLLREQVSS